MADRVGQQFGNYRLVRLLGMGGFSEVYLGEHIHLGMQAAIKLLHAQLAEEERERFFRETREIARLDHPNIVRVLEFGIEGNTPYLVTTYAPFGTVRGYYPKGEQVLLSTVAVYVRQIAAALDYAHGQHFVHRSVEPSKLFLGENDKILLDGFDLPPFAQDGQSRDAPDFMIGTLSPYIAPEQIQGYSSPASDQYSLAVVVYEWLTGEPPFRAVSTSEMIANVMGVAPPPLRTKVPSIAPVVEAVVLRALAKKPQDRFESIQAFSRAFEQAITLRRTRAFISYSHKDKAFLERLHSYLDFYLPGKTLDVWDDSMIDPGTPWREKIQQALDSAKVAILLISFDFLRSGFIRENELPPLLRAAQQDGITILPIVVRPCPLEMVEGLGQLQALNPPSKTVSEMTEPEQERFWMEATRRIQEALKV